MGRWRVSFSHMVLRFGIFMGYSWDIRRVFMGYTYVSVMCRLCIGYVSVMCWNILGAFGKGDNRKK